MSSVTTRRGFIAGSLLAPAALSSANLVSNEVIADGDYVLRLQLRRDQLLSEIRALDQKWRSAYEELPSWCRPGPKYLDCNGELFGPTVGWPAAETNCIALDSGVVLMRPSVRDIFELREADHIPKSGDLAEQEFRSQLRNFRDRMRWQWQIQRDVGLPRTSDWLPLETEIEWIDEVLGR